MAKDNDFIDKAKGWHKLALERYGENRERQRDDIRFAASSPDDPWQWDEKDRKNREVSARPALVINKMPQHIRQVTNDIRQNRPAIRYRPADFKADAESAEILMGIARHIEAHSNADVAYDTAADNQVTHGEGFIRVLTEYLSDTSFDQEIVIAPVANTFRVHLDPDREDPVGSDAKWAIIDDEIPEEEFKKLYPNAEAIDWNMDRDSYWFTAENMVMVAEVFCLEHKPAKLLLWANGQTSFEGDPMPAGVFVGEAPIKTRETRRTKLMWRKINGKEVLEEREFPCSMIPIARVVGNEWLVDGKRYWSGIVRNAKDSQRMYNVAQSAIVERVMQAPKAPWTTPAEAIEGYEKVWQTANSANHAYLPYNSVDAEGNPIPAPQRNAPTVVESGLQQVAMGAADDIKAETGQYDASLGARGNETSGRAILARQREGDTATFHYVDNLGRAVRHIGKIILDMIPRIYDTERVARILGEDGDIANVRIKPDAEQALAKVRNERGEIERIFNPQVGLYDVYVSTGPSFTTRRIEAVEAMTSMTQANPQLWQVIGDQLVKNMDWPGAEDMAERLKLTLLPPIQEKLAGAEGEQELPPQIKMAMDQMQGQLQAMDQAIQGMTADMQKLEDEKRNAELKADQKESENIRLKTELFQIKSIQEIEAARQASMQMQPAEVQPQPVAPMPPLVLPDVNNQLVGALGPVLNALVENGASTNQALSSLADGQAQLLQTVVQGQQVSEAMLAELSRPRTSSVRVVKQADGSFVGEKTEG